MHADHRLNQFIPFRKIFSGSVCRAHIHVGYICFTSKEEVEGSKP